eukprot:g17890.t1
MRILTTRYYTTSLFVRTLAEYFDVTLEQLLKLDERTGHETEPILLARKSHVTSQPGGGGAATLQRSLSQGQKYHRFAVSQKADVQAQFLVLKAFQHAPPPLGVQEDLEWTLAALAGSEKSFTRFWRNRLSAYTPQESENVNRNEPFAQVRDDERRKQREMENERARQARFKQLHGENWKIAYERAYEQFPTEVPTRQEERRIASMMAQQEGKVFTTPLVKASAVAFESGNLWDAATKQFVFAKEDPVVVEQVLNLRARVVDYRTKLQKKRLEEEMIERRNMKGPG